MKACVRCNTEKPRSEFKPAPTRDGLFPYCRDCDRAYQRARYARVVGGLTHPGKGDRAPAEERFLKNVLPEALSGCWLWTGNVAGSADYGRIKVNGRQTRAHRYSWELFRGEIPAGMFVCHRCDVPLCVNPNHLFLGTNAENTADKISKGRQAKGPSLAIAQRRGKEMKRATV